MSKKERDGEPELQRLLADVPAETYDAVRIRLATERRSYKSYLLELLERDGIPVPKE